MKPRPKTRDGSPPPRPKTSGDAYAHALAITLPGLRAVGAQTYAPRYETVTRSPPRVSFGTGRRFVSTKLAFISKEHNQDMLCSLSPGPIYEIGSPRSKVGPRWMSREEVLLRKEKQQQKGHTLTLAEEQLKHVGPGSYSPHEKAVRAHAPRPVVGTAPRFSKLPFISDQHQITLGGEGRPGPAYEFSEALTAKQPPAWSFGPRLGTAPASSPKRGRLGGGRRKSQGRRRSSPGDGEGEEAEEEEEEELEEQGGGGGIRIVFPPSRPRDSYWTQDIKGCMAKPATLECDIGPGQYNVPDPSDRHGRTFSKAGRFTAQGVEFISSTKVGTESPGPKYTPQDPGIIGGKPSRNKTKGYTWVP